MACRDTLPSDTSFLLEYLEQLPYESDSDGDKFEGYLAQMTAMLYYPLYRLRWLRGPRASISSLSLPFAGQPNRHGPAARSASLLCQALAPPSPPCTLVPRMQLLTASHTQLLTPYSGTAKSRTMAKARTIGLVL